MRKRHYTAALALFMSFCLNTNAKSSVSPDVTGTVLDENGKPMPFANVVLLSSTDSTFIMGTTSDESGLFTIKVPDNKGILRVTSVGYDTQYINITSNNDKKHTIRMVAASTELTNVTVKAAKPRTRITGNGLITEVAGSVLEQVGSAEDLLSRIPGLIKGKDGIEVIGKGSPLYYINGRKVRNIAELKRLRSYEILSVEVINTPGAQYDATVSSVVRIKTVRRAGEGLSFDLGVQDEQSLRIRKNNDQTHWLNMNYRINNVDIFTGGNYSEWSHRQSSYLFQQTYGKPSFRQEGPLEFNQKTRQYEFNFGSNWQINDKQSVGFKFSRNNVFHDKKDQSLKENAYIDDIIQDSILALGNHDYITRPYTTNANAYYNGSAGKLGIDLNVDYYMDRNSELDNTDETSSVDGLSNIRTATNSKNKLWAGKLVFSYPVWKGQLQFGTEQTFTRRNEDYKISSNSEHEKNNTSKGIPSTISEVKEDNYAGFVEYSFALPKIGMFSAGLRYEHVEYSFDSDIDKRDNINTSHENIETKYNDFFPSFSWATAIPLKNGTPVQISASYTMKTIRPQYYDLNSAIRYHSRYVWQRGDAGLRNQTNHEVGLNARYKWITFTSQYVRQDNAFSRWSELFNDQGVVLVSSCNLNDPIHNLSTYFTFTPVIGCWTMQYTAGIQQQWFRTDAKDPREPSGIRRLDFSDKPHFVAQFTNAWTFGAKTDGTGAWLIELGGTLMTKGYSMNTELTNNYFNLTGAIQKSFLKNNALVARIDFNDILKTADYDILSDCGSHVIKQTNSFDNHRIKATLTYNFNTARSKYKGTGAGKDAQQRMKGNTK